MADPALVTVAPGWQPPNLPVVNLPTIGTPTTPAAAPAVIDISGGTATPTPNTPAPATAATPAPTDFGSRLAAAQAAAGVAPAAPGTQAAPVAPPSFEDRLAAAAAAAGAPQPGLFGPNGAVANVGAGTSQGVASFIGMPVDLTTDAMNLGLRALGLPQISDPVLGSEFWKHMFGYVGANPDSVVAQTPAMRMLREASQGATSMLLPGGIARALPATTGLLEALRAGVGAGGSPSGVVAGAAGGATGSVAQENVAPEYKPLADIIGNLAGATTAGGVTAILQSASRAAGAVGRAAVAPMSFGQTVEPLNPATGSPFPNVGGDGTVSATPAQFRLAAGRLAGRMGVTPEQLPGAIPSQPEGVPGTHTIGQISGSQPVLNYERMLLNKNRVPFNAQRAANQVEWTANLIGLGDPNAVRTAVSDFILAELRKIEAMTPEEVARAAAARQQATALLPGVPQATTGARMAGAIEQNRAPAVNAANQAVENQTAATNNALEAIGGIGNATIQQTLGDDLQRGLDLLEQAKADQTSRLFAAVGPDGKLMADGSPIINEAESIQAEGVLRRNKEAPAGYIKDVIDLAAGQERGLPFRDLRDLRTRVTDALRRARLDQSVTRTQRAYLARILGAIDKAMAVGAGEEAGRQAPLVASGAMEPADTVGGQAAAASSGAPRSAPLPDAVFTPTGRPVGVSWRVMEGDQLVTSHDDDLRENPNYPQELQPRDRERKPSADQVQYIAGNLRPAELGVSGSTADGAPLVGPDRVVESGNGRVLGIRRAFGANGPQAQRYRDYISSLGFDVSGMREPVLVRMRTTELTPAQRAEVAAESNKPTTLQMSPSEGSAGGGGPPAAPAQPAASGPNVTEADRQRYATARASHAEGESTYHEGPIGDILRPGATKGEMVMQASRAASRVFHAGGGSAEDAQAFMRAIGGRTDAEAEAALRPRAVDEEGRFSQPELDRLMGERQRAKQALENSAAFSFRSAAAPNGVIDEKAAARWLRQNAPALDVFPDLRARMNTAVQQRARLRELSGLRDQLEKSNPLARADTMASIAGKYWTPGPAGREAVAQFAQDAGDTAVTQGLLRDAALETLRRDAFPDGAWNDAGYERWRTRYADALSQRPDIAADTADVAKAQRAVVDAAERRADALKDLQRGAAAHFLTKAGEPVVPQDAVNRLMRSTSGPNDMAKLMRLMASDPDATAGMRRLVFEWLRDQVTGTREAGTTGVTETRRTAFKDIQGDERVQRIIAQVFNPDQRQVISNILRAHELQARSVGATAIEGSPATAADTHSLGASEGKTPGLLAQMVMGHFGGEVIGHLTGAHGGVGGALVRGASTAGTLIYNAMRSAGFGRINEIESQMVINPELARVAAQMAAAREASPSLMQRFLHQVSLVATQRVAPPSKNGAK